jgi:uncharacterized protein (DUF111 family)
MSNRYRILQMNPLMDEELSEYIIYKDDNINFKIVEISEDDVEIQNIKKEIKDRKTVTSKKNEPVKKISSSTKTSTVKKGRPVKK